MTEAVVREVREETGYDVEVGAPVAEHTFTGAGIDRPDRPFKGLQVLFRARITGGLLGIVDLGAALFAG